MNVLLPVQYTTTLGGRASHVIYSSRPDSWTTEVEELRGEDGSVASAEDDEGKTYQLPQLFGISNYTIHTAAAQCFISRRCQPRRRPIARRSSNTAFNSHRFLAAGSCRPCRMYSVTDTTAVLGGGAEL